MNSNTLPLIISRILAIFRFFYFLDFKRSKVNQPEHDIWLKAIVIDQFESVAIRPSNAEVGIDQSGFNAVSTN